MSKHSPLPWHTDEQAGINDANGNAIADTVTFWRTNEEDQECAEFIVRAVNRTEAYEAMKAALETAKETIRAFNGLGMPRDVKKVTWGAWI